MSSTSRRQFLKSVGATGCSLSLAGTSAVWGGATQTGEHEAEANDSKTSICFAGAQSVATVPVSKRAEAGLEPARSYRNSRF